MRAIIPFFGSRVAPNLLFSDQSLIVQIYLSKIVSKKIVSTIYFNENDWIKLLDDYNIQVLICGGIDKRFQEQLDNLNIKIIKNVAGELNEIIEHLINGRLKQGYGISYQLNDAKSSYLSDINTISNADNLPNDLALEFSHDDRANEFVDCISCADKACLNGEDCQLCPLEAVTNNGDEKFNEILEVAYDISFEPEQVLCRVSELVYFSLGMNYKNIGVAFCSEMWHETEVICSILKRYFAVKSVCCKIGYSAKNDKIDPLTKMHNRCNPLSIAKILNLAKTDLNVAIGLCMGCDTIFNKKSEAPVTTLFVKDKLLAHNPVGAVYTKYALKQLEDDFH